MSVPGPRRGAGNWAFRADTDQAGQPPVRSRHVAATAPALEEAGQPRAAALISETTADGWLIIATCELSISTVVEPARAAMARSASGGIVRS